MIYVEAVFLSSYGIKIIFEILTFEPYIEFNISKYKINTHGTTQRFERIFLSSHNSLIIWLQIIQADAVLIGVIVPALVFARENAKRIRARKYTDKNGIKHYEIMGPLFFGSVKTFNSKFDVQNNPGKVIIDFSESRVAVISGIEALNNLIERYHKLGKKVHLKNLSADCRKLLKNAEDIIEVNVIEDPAYKVVADKLWY